MKPYTTDYLNNATESRLYLADRDVADQVRLPYEWREIKIKPNDLVTTHVINGAITKLYDNLLYILSQSMVPSSLIPDKQPFVDTTNKNIIGQPNIIDTGMDGLSAVTSYNSSQISALSSNSIQTAMNKMNNGLFTVSSSGHDCGVVLLDNGYISGLLLVRQDPQTNQMVVLGNSTYADNVTEKLLPSNNDAEVATALGGTSIGAGWYAAIPSILFGVTNFLVTSPGQNSSWVFMFGGAFDTGKWVWVETESSNSAWIYIAGFGWLYYSQPFFPWVYTVSDTQAGPAGWLYITDQYAPADVIVYNFQNGLSYDVDWSDPVASVNSAFDSESIDFTLDGSNVPTRVVTQARFRLYQDILYMLNPTHNNILKYDISGVTRHDNSFFNPDDNINGRILLDTIGGAGSVYDDARYNSLTCMAIDDVGQIYLVDVDTDVVVVKKYDTYMNHISTHDVSTHMVDMTPVDIEYMNNRLYMLTNGQIIEWTTNLEKLKTWTLTDELEAGEAYTSLTPSKENSNVVYVATTGNVFKKFLSKLDSGIGKLTYAGRGMGLPTTMQIRFVSTVDQGDVEHVFVGDAGTAIIYRFIESSNYQRIMNQTFESRFVSLDRLLVKGDEFVSTVVYNKTMAKLFYNHTIVSNSITSKLLSEYAGTKTKKFRTSQYLLQEYVQSRAFGTIPKLNNFVGINEMLLNSTINRTLEQIYDFQLKLLADIDTHAIDSPEYFSNIPDQPITDTISPDTKFAYVSSGVNTGEWKLESELE